MAKVELLGGALQLRATSCCTFSPVPLRLINTLALVDELLWTVRCPTAAPVTIGLNCTSTFTAKPGFKVTGNATPDIVKPVPVSVPELTRTGAVPVDASVTGSVNAVDVVTSPNVRLVGSIVNFGTDAFNCRVKLLETPPALAVIVTLRSDVTDDTLAVNRALLAFAGTVTVRGTVTAVLLLARLTS